MQVIAVLPFRRAATWLCRVLGRPGTQRHDQAAALRLSATALAKTNADLAREIAERKRIEAELRQAEAKYRSLFENVVEGIFQPTPDGR
jgi:PAS domain-containing protein